jgi:CHAT domain-containing protein
VLSACETGVGELAAGEGVYGLRRALVLAGSHSQVISLWKVNDTATQELMVAYYDHLLSGMPRDEALRETQLAFLNSTEYRHPLLLGSIYRLGRLAAFGCRHGYSGAPLT